MIENIVTEINGQSFYGWKDFVMSRKLQQVYSDVSFSAVDSPLILNSLWLPQNDLTVRFNDEVVFIGRIDTYRENIEASQDNQVIHNTSVTGRSLSAVISDSVFPDRQRFQQISGSQLDLNSFVYKLLREFDLDNNYEILGTPRSEVKHTLLSEYNTVERELINGLQLQGATPTATNTGGIRIFIDKTDYQQVGSISNLNKIELVVNERNRYHTYEVTGQTTREPITSGTASNSSTISTSTDEDVDQQNRVTRRRSIGNLSNSQEYAHWLNNTSFAKSRRLNIRVVGFRNDQGVLYEPGQLVRMSGDIFEASKASAVPEWLIEMVTYRQNDGQTGTVCDLSLIHPDAYLTEPRKQAVVTNSIISANNNVGN